MNPGATHALITDPVLIFFIVLGIILLAPLLLNKLKIPHIVGLIVAGVIVGPYGFNLLENDSSFAIFGQVGLLYLMFLAGLEIDMYHLRLNLRRGMVFGWLTFLVPLLLGTIASVYVFHMGWVTSLLLASMYASHTLISYPVVSRIGITKSPAVLISIVGTIISVLGALLVLAVAVEMNHTGEFSLLGLLKLLLRLGIYCLVVLYLYPRVTRWFFKNFSDTVSQYVFVMAMVFFSAWLSKVIGLEAVLGAFFAGLVLNRYIPNVSPLMHRIEFVGNALFIPYFLIGVGMLINVRVISEPSTLYIAANMIVVAIIGKWLAAWIAQKIYKMESIDRNVMFGLTTAHTAVALAVVMIGYEMVLPNGERLLDEGILNGTVLMILITCAIAPVVTASAAAKIKMRMLERGESKEDDVQNIQTLRTLIPVSNPITASSLVKIALMMKRRANDDSLVALHVRNDNSSGSLMIGKNALKLAADTAAAVNMRMQTIERYDVNTVTGIVNTVKERGITDVILGIHQKATIVDSFYGGKIEQLLSALNKMVIITRCYIPINTITRIVVAVPRNAEYETGFELWVIRLANLAKRIGCRVIFYAHDATIPFIKGVIRRDQYEIRDEYRSLADWSDFVHLSSEVLDDDLFVLINARRTSVSFNSDLEDIPNFLSKYFGHSNLLIIYPEQFGATPDLVSFSDPLTVELNSSPGLWLKVRAWVKWLSIQKKRVTHHYRKRRDLEENGQ